MIQAFSHFHVWLPKNERLPQNPTNIRSNASKTHLNPMKFGWKRSIPDWNPRKTYLNPCKTYLNPISPIRFLPDRDARLPLEAVRKLSSRADFIGTASYYGGFQSHGGGYPKKNIDSFFGIVHYRTILVFFWECLPLFYSPDELKMLKKTHTFFILRPFISALELSRIALHHGPWQQKYMDFQQYCKLVN